MGKRSVIYERMKWRWIPKFYSKLFHKILHYLLFVISWPATWNLFQTEHEKQYFVHHFQKNVCKFNKISTIVWNNIKISDSAKYYTVLSSPYKQSKTSPFPKKLDSERSIRATHKESFSIVSKGIDDNSCLYPIEEREQRYRADIRHSRF